MGAGIILLGAYGRLDLYISYKPEITYFKIVYKRHTYFSMEFIDQYFAITPNFGTKTSCVLFNNGDLVSDLFLNIQLPVLTKYINYPNSPEMDSLFAIRWVDYIGFSIINSIEMQIGGKTVQKLNGDWLYIYYNLIGFRNPYRDLGSHESGLKKLVGHYDDVIGYTSQKNSFSLNVPIPFWFTKNPGSALPLNCINFSEVKINLELLHLSQLIIYGPQYVITVKESICSFRKYEYIYQGNSVGVFFGFIPASRNLYFNLIKGSFITCTNSVEIECINTILNSETLLITNSSGAFMTPNTNMNGTGISFNPNLNIINCTLSANYIFLENEERKRFYNTKQEYIIDEIQYYTNSQLVSASNSVLVNFVNPVIEIAWFIQLNSNLTNLDYYNYTDSYDVNKGNNLILLIDILTNGYQVFSQRNADYTEYITIFESHLKAKQVKGLNYYSFSVKPEYTQPSGTCNFSKIEKVFLEFILTNVINYNNTATIKIIGRNYNILRIVNGIGELVF